MVVTEKQIADLRFGLGFWLKRWWRDPVAYSIECLGIVPTYQQAEILRASVRYKFVAVRSGHGIGKSRLGGIVVNWYLDTHSEFGKLTRVPITGAGGSQLESTLWAEVNSVNSCKWSFLSDRYSISSERMTSLENPKEWFAVLRTPRLDNPDALQGFHDCLFLIDEGSGVPDPIFEVARGAMGDPHSYGLMLGNPTRESGYFFNAFHNVKSVWHCLHYSSMDSLYDKEYSYWYADPFGDVQEIRHRGLQTQAWVDDMREEFGEGSNTFKIRVLGEFASGEVDPVVEKRWLADVFTNRVPESNSGRKMVMGIDPARTGNDSTGLVIRQGDEVVYIEEWHGADLVESRLRVQMVQAEWNCDYVGVDIIGVGAGLHDELRVRPEFRGRVYPVQVSEVAPEPNMMNCKLLRDWLWWQSRTFFRTHGIRFAGEGEKWRKLANELSLPTYRIQNGRLLVESKDDMKKRGVPSPNLADAFNITLLRDFSLEMPVFIQPQNGKKKRKQRQSWKVA